MDASLRETAQELVDRLTTLVDRLSNGNRAKLPEARDVVHDLDGVVRSLGTTARQCMEAAGPLIAVDGATSWEPFGQALLAFVQAIQMQEEANDTAPAVRSVCGRPGCEQPLDDHDPSVVRTRLMTATGPIAVSFHRACCQRYSDSLAARLAVSR